MYLPVQCAYTNFNILSVAFNSIDFRATDITTRQQGIAHREYKYIAHIQTHTYIYMQSNIFLTIQSTRIA